MSSLLVAMTVVSGIQHGCGSGAREIRTDRPWPWWPVSMEISTLTRVGRVGEDGVRPVEVRIRFEDQDGDPCKASGELTLTIVRAGEPGDPERRTIDLVDPDLQRRYYESVTGCYAIPVYLDLPGMVPGRLLRIGADFQSVDGATFGSQGDLVLQYSLQARN